MISSTIQVTIPFHDVDMMEITWHGHYAKYFEIARCSLLDKIGYNYFDMKQSGYSWPVIELHIRYAKPCHFQQTLNITASIKEWENRLKIDYVVTDAITGQRQTKGHTIQVAVDLANEEMCFVCPTALTDKIDAQKN